MVVLLPCLPAPFVRLPKRLRMVASTTINKGSNALTADDSSLNNRLKKRSTFATRELIDRSSVERISLTRIARAAKVSEQWLLS